MKRTFNAIKYDNHSTPHIIRRPRRRDRSTSPQTTPPRAADLRVRVARDHPSRHRIAPLVRSRTSSVDDDSTVFVAGRLNTKLAGHFTCFRRDARETTGETARRRVAIAPRTRRRVARVRTRARAIGRVVRLGPRRRARRSAIARAARRRGRVERMSLRMSIVELRRVDAMNDRTGRTRGRKGETRRSTRG